MCANLCVETIVCVYIIYIDAHITRSISLLITKLNEFLILK